MKTWILYVLFCLFSFAAFASSDDKLNKYISQLQVDKPTLQLIKKEEYQLAIESILRQSKNLSHEVPIFEHFLDLAIVYHLAGDKQRSMWNLKRYEVALKVLIGMYSCRESEEGF